MSERRWSAVASDRGGDRAPWWHEPCLAHTMLELSAPDGVADDLLELIIAGAIAHRRP
jgi:hypothetical protein